MNLQDIIDEYGTPVIRVGDRQDLLRLLAMEPIKEVSVYLDSIDSIMNSHYPKYIAADDFELAAVTVENGVMKWVRDYFVKIDSHKEPRIKKIFCKEDRKVMKQALKNGCSVWAIVRDIAPDFVVMVPMENVE